MEHFFLASKINLNCKKAEIEKEIVLEMAHRNSVNKSNVGGWHSQYKLHESNSTLFNTLSQEILEICQHLLTKYKTTINSEIKMSQFWVNVNRKGDWNSPHNHCTPDSSHESPIWSGVYYVDVEGAVEASENDTGGELILFFSDENGTVNNRTFKPKNGQLVLFKSDLLHMVTPSQLDTDRVSIAFNLFEQ